MPVRILIMGLPGAGKTTLAKALQARLDAEWFNADVVRQQFDDWDFSHTGRLRQSIRMRQLCDSSNSLYTIADFVCPLPEMRVNFEPNLIIWVDTITEGKYDDTNKMFVPPEKVDVRVTTQSAEYWAEVINDYIRCLNLPN